MVASKMQTKFGTATLCGDKYYHITTNEKGNNGKKLHRLIYEDYYGVTLPSEIHVHYIDGDTTNNDISNLTALHYSEHHRQHMLGENNPMYGKVGTNKGKTFSEETCRKISENHVDVSGSNNPKWGTSAIEEWGGLWFLIEMKKQVGTITKVTEFTGLTSSMIRKYLKVRGYKWSTLLEQVEVEQNA